MYTESFKLGYFLNKLGLTPEDLEKIMNGSIKLNQKPEDIREFILRDCDLKVTFLRSMSNIGINPYELGNILNVDANLLINNTDNFAFWINNIDFRVKINVNHRRQIVKFLTDKNISLNSIADILDVAVSTVQNDKNYLSLNSNFFK